MQVFGIENMTQGIQNARVRLDRLGPLFVIRIFMAFVFKIVVNGLFVTVSYIAFGLQQPKTVGNRIDQVDESSLTPVGSQKYAVRALYY